MLSTCSDSRQLVDSVDIAEQLQHGDRLNQKNEIHESAFKRFRYRKRDAEHKRDFLLALASFTFFAKCSL